MIHQTADAITMFRLIEHNMESLEFDEAEKFIIQPLP
jgi:hypothetical protein